MNDTTPEQPTEAVAAQAGGGRYSVADDGQIFFQPQANNPLPGVAVGRVVKGDGLLAPKAVADGHDKVQEWLDIHVRTVLEPLFKLKQVEGEGALTGVAAGIGERLYEHLGVIHRSDLEDLISGLDADMRKALRTKGVRLGPVLAFLPALVKPAAIKMRALLWGLWNDKALPVAKPSDGRVSEVVDPAAIDRNFYRMIGYPVFGPRCIRIDMIDRVVTDIYDTAVQGVFEAKHKYAEWFGSSLDDLYAILESMGHRRLKDAPKAEVAEVAAEGAAEVAVDAAQAVAVVSAPTTPPAISETLKDEASVAAVEVVEAVAADQPLQPKAQPVPVKFILKRGKMSERPQPKHSRPRHSGENRSPEKDKNKDKPDSGVRRNDKKDEEKKFSPKKAYDPNRPQGKRNDRDGEHRPRKPKFDRDKDRNREAKVYTFGEKLAPEDDANNPFAILKNLKK